MRKYILVLLILFTCGLAFAQTPLTLNPIQVQQLKNLTPAQLQELKTATPAQIEALKKATQGGKPPVIDNVPDKSDKSDKSSNDPSKSSEREGIDPQDMEDNPNGNNYDDIDKYRDQDELVIGLIGRRAAMRPIYGREIFTSSNLTFAPSMSMATPPGYILAAGDELNVTLWGAAEATYTLKVSPEGNINIPNVGLVSVSGLSVSTAENRIKNKLVSAVSGLSDGTVNVKVTLGNIRSIKVNIVGEASKPGTYTLPSLSTLFNALYAADGVNSIGSLRNIKLYRAGKEMATLDVYDYLLKGKTDIDMRLEDNDMIVVAPYDNIVTVTGRVKRPRAYEMKRDEDLATLIEYAGGYVGDAYTENLSLIRRSGGRQYAQYTIKQSEVPGFSIFDRDVVSIGEIIPVYINKVDIDGAVWRPGPYELSENMRTVRSLIEVAEGITPDAYLGRAQIIRLRPDMMMEILPFNLGSVMSGAVDDIELVNGDQLVITSIDNLKENQTIEIKGEVNAPQLLPFVENMTIQDVIIAARGLKEAASLSRIEVARRVKDPNASESTTKLAEVFTFTIPEDLSLTDEVNDFKIQPFDEIHVRRSPGYSEQQNVYISGQVAFDGEYTLSQVGTRLTDLVDMAGGLTSSAYVKGATLERVVTNSDLQRIESLRSVRESTKLTAEQLKLNGLAIGDYYTIGIDLQSAIADPQGVMNIVLKRGDRLIVPTLNSVVKISGAVYYPNSTVYLPDYKVRDYIKAAGGYTRSAKKRPFVIYANGTVSAKSVSRMTVEPGCEIVIPQKPYVESMGPQAWIGITTSVVSMAAMIVSILK